MCARQALHHLSYIPSPFFLFSESYYVIQASLKLMVLLPQPLKHWDDRHVPLQLAPSLYCEAGTVLDLNLAKGAMAMEITSIIAWCVYSRGKEMLPTGNIGSAKA